MFWWILLGIGVVLTIMFIVFAIIDLDFNREVFGILALLIGLVPLIIGLCLIVIPIENKKAIEEFKRQKYYIEVTAKELPTTDNYALTMKRIELNEWLYNAQYSYENYKFFTLYTSEVMELEEIR